MNTVENNTNTNSDVETMTERARRIFTAINDIAVGMADRENIRVEDLAKKVSKVVSLDVKAVIGYINDFGKNSTIGYIDRGAHGGFVKGVKQVKTVKSGKKSKKTVS